LKRHALIALVAIVITLAAIVVLQSNGYFAYLSSLGLHDTPIKAIVNDPASYDGKNITVIGVIGSRETTTWMRSSLTIKDSEGFYIDLLKPVPSWLKYDIEMPFMITGTFIYYEYGSNDTKAEPLEEGYGIVPLSIEKVYTLIH
jgi:hypothetical protein